VITKSRFIEVPKEWKKVIELSHCHGIVGRHLLKFYYKSKPKNKNESGNEGYRIVSIPKISPANSKGWVVDTVKIF
jgi:hypothetical protein